MTKSYFFATIRLLLFALISISACSGQDKSSLSESNDAESEPATGDWNQFLGPNRDGVITDGNHIPANPKLDVAWSRDLGFGFSGILVSDGYLFTMHTQGAKTVMTCFKADTGETVWQYDVAPFFLKEGSDHGGPLSTPALDSKQVYGLVLHGNLFALKRDSGEQVWKVQLEEELGAIPPNVGFATSPLVIGNRVIVQIGNTAGKSTGAFDTKSGKLAWSSGAGTVMFQSPSLVNFLGKSYLIAPHKHGLDGLDPETGNVLWNHEDEAGVHVLPTGNDSFLLGFVDSDYVHYRVTDSLDRNSQRTR